MRRLLVGVICCFVAVVWASPAQAQTAGFKGGLVRAELDGEPEEPGATFERKSGWAAGLFVRFGIGPLALQPEVLYVRRGSAVEGPTVAESAELQMDFVEVPVLLRLGSGGTALYGGGYGALKVDAKAVSDSAELDLSSEIEDFDYGVLFGVSLGLGKFEVEGRYTMGLQNLIKDPAAPELKNRTISALASFSF